MHIPDQDLIVNFTTYTIDLKAVFEDEETKESSDETQDDSAVSEAESDDEISAKQKEDDKD